jgi:uncharacterized protein
MKLFGFLALLLAIDTSLATAQTAKPSKILFLVGGLYHNYDELPQKLTENLRERMKSAGGVDFTITKDISSLRKEELSKYDGLMINVCEQTALDSEEKQGLLDAVTNGMPVVAMHCTFWSFQAWPEFRKILGAFVPGHDPFGTFCLKVVAPNSPIAKGVPSTFDPTDEPYIVFDRDRSMKVIVRTCKPLKDGRGRQPEVWTKTYGKGRIFAITLGHDGPAQANPNYQILLTNGLLWALGRQKER